MNRGILTVVSGFSGAGKGTLMKELLKQYDNYALSISCTTRSPREGEEDGVHYFFKTREEFEAMIADNGFLEYAEYVNNYYGTPVAYVQDMLNQGRDVILEIEIQGALKVKQQYPDTLLLFVTPPSAEELERRLVNRGTETAEVIRFRMNRAVEEAEYMDRYDYLVINDDLQTCVEEMHELIQSQKNRASNRGDMIDKMKKELKIRKENKEE
ncbi:MAG: guanylate kinase [Lachnospiraceae bacterium]|nr:guanylate kinase [Lachnospiraceae bacterium]